jgi:microcystin-dependent protein
MAEPFVGEIKIVGFNFPPRGYAMCSGQLLAISQNTALFSLLGTQFGGNGQTTFALPNLQSRMPVHQGQGPGLSDRVMGEMDGVESVTLLTTEMPQHTHVLAVSGDAADRSNADGNYLAVPPDPAYAVAASSATLGTTTGATGSGFPHSNLQPYLALNFVIALQGVFPARN